MRDDAHCCTSKLILSDRLLTATNRGMRKFAAHWQTGPRLHQPCSPLIASGVPFGSQALGGWISNASARRTNMLNSAPS